MKIEIHTFNSAVRYEPKDDEKTIMIRISDPDFPKERDKRLDFEDKFQDVLKISFYDLTDEQVRNIKESEPGELYETISTKQAEQTIQFVEENVLADKLIIHCSAGVSRSPGLGIGIARHLGLKQVEHEIETSSMYLPNQTVIKRIEEASIYKIK